MERDAVSAAAEYGAEFRTDIEAFVSREAVEACVALGVRERPYLRGQRYQAFVDPSGGSADSFTLAIGHKADDVAVLDALREVRPHFSPESVVGEFAALLKSYHVHRVEGDRYAGEWPREQFRKVGITYEVASSPKSALYQSALPLINSRRADLLDDPRLLAQLCALERRTARGGKDSIDHPPGAHDDVANAVAGLLVRLVAKAYDSSFSWVSHTDGKPDYESEADLARDFNRMRLHQHLKRYVHYWKGKAMIRIRRKNGTTEMVDDDYILADGESMAIQLTFVDGMDPVVTATLAAMSRDADEEQALHRPGYRYTTDSKLADAVDMARAEYLDYVGNAWRDQPRTRKERRERQKQIDMQEPLSVLDAERMREEAYQQYITNIENAWRT